MKTGKNLLSICTSLSIGLVASTGLATEHLGEPRELVIDQVSRRLPPIMTSLTLPETPKGDTYIDVNWAIEGYHDSYRSAVAVFECANQIDENCGATVSDAYDIPRDLLLPIEEQRGDWGFEGTQTSIFSYKARIKLPPVVEQKDLAVRFYVLSDTDEKDNKRSVSLLINGGLDGIDYLGSTGRMVKLTVQPNSPECIITKEELESGYNVKPNDGLDDTDGFQMAINSFNLRCLNRNNNNRALIELPSGLLNISKGIFVDQNHLTIKGQGGVQNSATPTMFEFTPDDETQYPAHSSRNSKLDLTLLNYYYSSGKKINGSWLWPGRAIFKIQSRNVHSSYLSVYNSLPENKKEILEGSINFHWKAGVPITENSYKGESIIKLTSVYGLKVGQSVWVLSPNTNNLYDSLGMDYYDEYGDEIRVDSPQLRQKIYLITEINETNRTIRIDQPLEFDLLVSQTSDGSRYAINSGSKSAQVGKIVPLDAVDGVRFENFHLYQTSPLSEDGTPYTEEQAKNNYTNLDVTKAIHGFLFKYAVNPEIRHVSTSMIGGHPLVTEVASNLVINNNQMIGSWNKGLGGMGYFRLSKVWNSEVCHNEIYDLRHLTLQYSSSRNLICHNNLNNDFNNHGGLERFNIIENNDIAIPFEHRNCEPNCSESETDRWYPYYWSTSQKATWASPTGQRNILFNNIMSYQEAEDGPYVPYPYSTKQVIHQFGWGENGWEHLKIGDKRISNWSGVELEDFSGNGVDTSCTYSGKSLLDSAEMECGGESYPLSDLR
ncbi:MAG: hypothetical protein HQL54_02800 [Magnetococcales bacterium]|nr:hypothetical protein [Magnetococcales bacterium]